MVGAAASDARVRRVGVVDDYDCAVDFVVVRVVVVSDDDPRSDGSDSARKYAGDDAEKFGEKSTIADFFDVGKTRFFANIAQKRSIFAGENRRRWFDDDVVVVVGGDLPRLFEKIAVAADDVGRSYDGRRRRLVS